MTQTKKYQLNLIEKDDTFSPDPLNENMEKVEGALTAADSARQSADKALETRIAALEKHRTASGSFRPSADGPITINLGFTPKVVIILGFSGGFGMLLPNSTLSETYGAIVTNGFQIAKGGTSSALPNPSRTYAYAAFN